MRCRIPLTVAVVCGTIAGCHCEPPAAAPSTFGAAPMPASTPTPPAPASPPPETGAAQPTSSNPEKERSDLATQCELHIADEIKAVCGLKQDQPQFAFDSAAVAAGSDQMLGKLADCFATGPLKRRDMFLVGHADPRGSDEYNMQLGERRANSVKAYLERKGLAGSRVETASRGKRDATGTDEPGWAHDRRVDVLLMPSSGSETGQEQAAASATSSR